MTVEKIRGENENCDNFPVGLRVLAVDDDPTCLMLLDSMLRKCQYHVTTSSQARMALKMLRENKDRFDLVISDVHMPDIDGFKLLELVGLEMDLPVIMLSGNGDPKLVMKGVTHGACDYLVKPVRIEELRNIWQHVIRKKKCDPKNNIKFADKKGDQANVEGTAIADQNGKFSRKRKDEEDLSEDNGNENEDPSTQKKPRVVWSIELHRKFVAAVNQLGIEKAVPKRILDMMNIEGLTRENVASHLQKYRLYLKRISSVATQQANMAAALGVRDSPFMRIGSFDGLADFRAFANVGLSHHNTTGGGMLGRLNTPANINLRSLAPSSLIQPNNGQTLTNPLTSLGKMHPVLPTPNQNPSLFQGMPSPLEFDQLQQLNFNPVDQGAAIGGSSNILQQFGNHSANNMASSIQQNPLLLTEPFRSRLPMNSERHNDFSGGPYLQNNTADISPTAMALPLEGSREVHCQEEGLFGDWQKSNQTPNQMWGDQGHNYGHSSKTGFGSLNARIPANGIVSPLNENLVTESRVRDNDNFLLEQPNLQDGFVHRSYDSLDDMMSAMIKREQDENIPNCDFGLDDFSFGPGI